MEVGVTRLSILEHPLLGGSAPQLIDAMVTGDRQQPRPEGPLGVIAVVRAPRAQEDLRASVLGGTVATEHATADAQHVCFVRAEPLAEARGVARVGPRHRSLRRIVGQRCSPCGLLRDRPPARPIAHTGEPFPEPGSPSGRLPARYVAAGNRVDIGPEHRSPRVVSSADRNLLTDP